ncbi:hypothetical protein C8R47DRAFT_995273 [Mycena vitilis]|nr:hypothetical protein C8R47DRAFT_995273 [Mycena vitilis]
MVSLHLVSVYTLTSPPVLGFPERSDKEHRQRQQEYLKCKTAAARKAFVKMFATRWCQLSRLPYFDLCRMIVIDPMHNLLLGEAHLDHHVLSLIFFPRSSQNSFLSNLGPSQSPTQDQGDAAFSRTPC